MPSVLNRFFWGENISVDDPLDGDIHYTFPADNRRIRKRVRKIGSKEPGTVRWLHETLRPDDTVLDVGANIGIYSVFAAARTSRGRVYAIEPHAGSFAILLKSISANSMEQRITPLNIALDKASGWIDFTYNKLQAGSSGSQLASSPLADETPAVVTEQKLAQSVDGLIAAGGMTAPNVVKIDVDGNELNILKGMSDLLSGTGLRAIQVEADPSQEKEIVDFLTSFGYRVIEKHLSAAGARHMAQHGPQATYAYNYVFRK